MNTAPFANAPVPLGETSAGMDKSRLSALADGELTDHELQALLLEQADSREMLAIWTSYQVIGDALRGTGGATACRAPQDFLAGVRAGLHGAPGDSVSAPDALPLTAATRHVDALARPAANDPVFRWKMVAGLASLAAVMAVSWTVLGTSQATSGSGGAQLALMETVPAQPSSAPAIVVAGESRNVSQPVVVNTNQGPLIRDARLEALMAEHRHGGVSALQMPAGFLRNATYDDAGR
jgi:sigma-E factor negative regulatory protein RseA